MPSGSAKHPTKPVEKKHCAFEDLDHSILQEPLNLGVTNVKQILKCVQSGSKEVKDLILNECNLIYECKVCLGLFRSLANFMYHKRCYCKKHVCEKMVLFRNFDDEPEEPVLVHPEAPQDCPEKEDSNGRDVLPKMMECTVELVKADVPDHIPFPESAPKTLEDAPRTSPAVREKAPKTSSVVPKRANKLPSTATEKAPKRPSTIPDDVPETASVESDLETSTAIPESPPDVPETPLKVPSASTKEQGANKGKSKPPNEKRVDGSSRPESAMISRRTRDKSNQQISNAHKLPVESSSDEEPPPKTMKVTARDTENASCDERNSSAVQSPIKNKQEKNEMPIKCTITKSLSSFPKFVLKPIDCKSSSILKNVDQKKNENITIKSLQSFPIQTKLDKNKLVIVLKKKEASSVTPDPNALLNKQRSECQKLNEFHLTRRKRLMSRNDCNVHELKCLVCKTQFMSLKTLYFHMLSLHSKKRLYYPCPFCKTLFVQMYGVTRHLISIHNKSKEQINKLREMIKKKSVWKRVDDADVDCPEKPRQELGIESYPLRPDDESKPNEPAEAGGSESSPIKTVIKIGKNSALHTCSKCNRVFGRKSSQVSHEKFCIMNAIKVDNTERSPSPAPVPVPRPTDVMPVIQKEEPPLAPSPSPESPSVRISARPKRGAEKLMHKDFVNSQTLKWRSANKIIDSNKLVAKKANGKNLEKKVLNIMDAENLVCLKCDKKFSSFSNLRRHIAIHVGWTRFKCKHCDYQAYNKSQCWAHVQKAHPSSDADIEKSIVHLSGGNLSGIKPFPEEEPSQKMKRSLEGQKSFSKSASVTKMKAPKKKSIGPVKSLTLGPVRSLTLPKKSTIAKRDALETRRDSADGKKENRENKKEGMDSRKDARDGKRDILDNRKDGWDSKRDVREGKKDGWDGKRDVRENKKDTSDGKKDVPERRESMDGKKESRETKRDTDTKKEASDHNKKEPQVPKQDNPVYKREAQQDNKIPVEAENDKKEKPPVNTITKICVPEYKKEINYKSMTTNNPTTIILSKRIPSSSVQSVVTFSPGTVSSSNLSPVRTSPRKNEIKFPEIKQLPKLQGLVTRSSGPSIQLKLPVRSIVGEKSEPVGDKTYARKDRLISEWFPKKDLNSNNARRESAPVIIGLVPASGSGLTVRTKSPGITFESAP